MNLANKSSITALPKDEDLHLFIPNVLNLRKNLLEFCKIFSLRTWTNKEFWILDISRSSSIDEVVKVLDNNILNLDIDDDLYLISFDNEIQLITIWEYYRIHITRPAIMEHIGMWNEFEGLNIVQSEKWKRRGNLKVHISQSF